MRKHLLRLLFLVILGFSSAFAQEKLGIVSGRVTEKISGQPIPNAAISASGVQTVTDSDGYYRLELPVGTHNIHVVAEGFAEITTGQITITSNRTYVENVMLSIMLADERVEINQGIFVATEDQPISQTTLNRDAIRNTPGTGGDILRAISSLPSVTSVGAEFGDYFVRGGKTDENMVVIDNIPVADFTLFSDKYDGGQGGRSSVLASDIIQNADFSAGGFGARYGDKMSSVLDVTLRESNRTRIQGSFFSDFGNMGASVDIPFGSRGGWISSFRRSYIDVVFDLLNLGDIGRPRNWDFFNRGVYQINNRNNLSFTAVNSFENFSLSAAQATASDRRTDRLRTERGGQKAIVGTTLSTTIGESSLSQATLWFTSRHNNGSLWRVDANNTLQRTRDLRDLQIGVKEHLSTNISKKLDLSFGGGLTFEQSNYYSFERSGNGFSALEEEWYAPDRSNRMVLDSKTSVYGYAVANFRPSPRVSLSPSVRVDHYGITNENVVSPRFAARFAATGKIALTFATGIYRQLPGLFTMSLTPANRNLGSQRATHVIAGIEWLPRDDLRFRIEGFTKRYDNLVIQPILGNYNYTNGGSGSADGIEVSLQKALGGGWAGQISYSFINSRRRLTSGDFAFPSDEERPHQFTAIAITKIWGITVAAKVRIATGVPYDERMPIRISTTPLIYLQRVATVQNRNALRIPYYRDVDMRIERKFNFKRWSIAPYFDAFNIFALNYKTQVNYELNRRTVQFLGEGVRIPILGVRVEF